MKKQRQTAALDMAKTEVPATAEQGREAAPKNAGYAPPEAGIGERIRTRREDMGLSVEALARLTKLYDKREGSAGISAPMIGRYEKRGFKPGAREVCLLCDALEVTADWLVRGVASTRTDMISDRSLSALVDFLKVVFEEHGEDMFLDLMGRSARVEMAKNPEENG